MMGRLVKQSIWERLRNPLAWLCFVSLFLGVACATQENVSDSKPLLDFYKIASSVAAVLSAIAYNLRSKYVGFVLKKLNKTVCPSTINLTGIKRTCKRLTNLTLLSFLTAIACLLAGVIYNKYFSACAAGLIAASIVQYIYALYAYDSLECQILDDAYKDAAKIQ